MMRPTKSILEQISAAVHYKLTDDDVIRFVRLSGAYGTAEVNYALYKYLEADPLVFPSIMQIESIIKKVDAERSV